MKTTLDLSMEEQTAIKRLRIRIQKAFPNWSFLLTLFGSQARGDATADSDVDILVEIRTHNISFEEKRRIRRLAGDLSTASELILSLLRADRLTLEQRDGFSLFRNKGGDGLGL